MGIFLLPGGRLSEGGVGYFLSPVQLVPIGYGLAKYFLWMEDLIENRMLYVLFRMAPFPLFLEA